MSQFDTTSSARRFGTLGGVFTPCVLTIIGVILFLRFGQVVGTIGIVGTIAIVIISKLLTGITSLSLSAIATNTRVEGGGAYYMVSRSLGVESGGAIGVVFFLAQAISVSMYVIGFTEALVILLPELGIYFRVTATVVNLIVFASVWIGAGWTIKLQYFILAILVFSVIAFSIGAVQQFDFQIMQANLFAASPISESVSIAGAKLSLLTDSNSATGGWFSSEHFSQFMKMFALFFPAVTGIMAGANMSGELKDPAKSIPLGTISAIFVTAGIYISMAVLLGCCRDREVLLADPLIMRQISIWGPAVMMGVFAATLSSALGSMMGAPRILQALAQDNVFKRLSGFGVNSRYNGEPRRALLAVLVISQVGIFVGDLNAIAPVITMAFLATYGLLNLSAFYEALTKNPSYRPTFRFTHWSVSLVGALGCLVTMVLIDYVAALVVIVGMLLLFRMINLNEVEARWGDVQSGLLFERARTNLWRLEQQLEHPKNWRPIILTLCGGAGVRPHLPVFGHWLAAGHGIQSLGQVIHGDVENQLQRRIEQLGILRHYIEEQQIKAFPTVIVTPYLSDGVESLVQCHGLGALRPNTVLMGWPQDESRAQLFGSIMRSVAGLGCSVVAIRLRGEGLTQEDDPWQVPQGPIDVWWRGMKNGELMLLLAHMLHQGHDWRQREIRLLRAIESEGAHSEISRHLEKLIQTARIPASPKTVVAGEVAKTIQNTSKESAVAILGFEPPVEGQERQFFENLEKLTQDLPRVIFVNSAGGMQLDS